ncbi:MAG: oligosaccharide flippase family protein, partial [Alistipes sp.]|nr:oligosaccharide flippase family protein [Alistipes sp.]
MEEAEKSTYRQILKATGVFGGVQVFSIVINLLKSKIIAFFLGPEGVGIYSLFQNPVQLISQISGLGINTSAIRDVAQCVDNEEEQAKTVKTVRAWSRITGAIGALFLLFAAPQISCWTFGNGNYALDFRFLSIAVFLIALGNENDVILKGRRKIVYIAKAGVFSSLCGLIVS